MTKTDQPEVKFEGEDANSGFASPALDLVATAILIAIAVTMMVASWRLPMPGEIHTAPGLLPFIIAASLLLMALGVGASALARCRSGSRIPIFGDRDVTTDFRSLLLAVAVSIYIAALQVLAFQHNIAIFGTNLRLTAFEPATIVALCSIIHVSWRGPIWITVLISVAWTLVLSLVFQLVFRIPLPGSF
ncbi:tripartite tricarboxylate transporter TctB family protein [Tateyamaria sp.]|uniref:tripartite tricarboxylate transporter TctB family protein n=1 Tax=Tateyamaria sp. TaxID=1929288 RepID=UPI003B2245FE